MMADKKRVGAGFGIMLLNKYKQVLLGRRHDDPEKADSALNGAGTWCMPGGKMEFGESFEEGAKRELMEETGMVLEKVRVICVTNDKVEEAHFVTLGLFSEYFNGEPQVMEPDEITEWQWFDLGDLPSPLFSPTDKILRNYSENKFYVKRD